jgi:hypothetical protein
MEHSDDIAESHNLGAEDNMLNPQGKDANPRGRGGGLDEGSDLDEGEMQEVLDEY